MVGMTDLQKQKRTIAKQAATDRRNNALLIATDIAALEKISVRDQRKLDAKAAAERKTSKSVAKSAVNKFLANRIRREQETAQT
jgi:hypothetical protein